MDGFDILREKWIKLFHIHTRDTQCVHTLDSIFHNIASMNNAGATVSGLLEITTGYHLLSVAGPPAKRFGEDKYQTTRDEFIEAFGWFYIKYPRLFRQRWEHCYEALFESIDINKDGVILIEEFKIFNRSTHMPDEAAEKIFALLDADGDGMITKEEYVGANLRYMCDPCVSDAELPLSG